MAGGGTKARVEADGFAVAHEPLGAGLHILGVLRLRGDAGEADVIAEFVNEALLVALQVIQGQLHEREYPGKAAEAKQIGISRHLQ
jgi:hypothetical protein